VKAKTVDDDEDEEDEYEKKVEVRVVFISGSFTCVIAKHAFSCNLSIRSSLFIETCT
jgi:hypothetical protein